MIWHWQKWALDQVERGRFPIQYCHIYIYHYIHMWKRYMWMIRVLKRNESAIRRKGESSHMVLLYTYTIIFVSEKDIHRWRFYWREMNTRPGGKGNLLTLCRYIHILLYSYMKKIYIDDMCTDEKWALDQSQRGVFSYSNVIYIYYHTHVWKRCM